MIILSVIGAAQLVNGVWMGTVLILLGLFPGLLQGFADAITRFAGALPFWYPVRSGDQVQIHQPRWFAAVGATLIVLTLFAYWAR
ncbi:MAG: hypothetical protein WAM85_17700 [Terracidiphilus sp.]